MLEVTVDAPVVDADGIAGSPGHDAGTCPAMTSSGGSIQIGARRYEPIVRRPCARGPGRLGNVSAVEGGAGVEQLCRAADVVTLPIRFLPTPPRCRVLPGTGVKLCIGRCGNAARCIRFARVNVRTALIRSAAGREEETLLIE